MCHYWLMKLSLFRSIGFGAAHPHRRHHQQCTIIDINCIADKSRCHDDHLELIRIFIVSVKRSLSLSRASPSVFNSLGIEKKRFFRAIVLVDAFGMQLRMTSVGGYRNLWIWTFVTIPISCRNVKVTRNCGNYRAKRAREQTCSCLLCVEFGMGRLALSTETRLMNRALF